MKRVLILLFCLVACAINAQMATEKNNLPWQYPVLPGTDEWKELQIKFGNELIDTLQIPGDILSSISTTDLTALCMQYPLLLSVTTGDSHETALDKLFEQFNGIRELFKREDASKELLKHYQELIQNLPDFIREASNGSRVMFIMPVAALELLLSRYQSTDDSNKENYVEIVQFLVNGYENKRLYPEFFSEWSIRNNVYSRAKIFVKMDVKNLENIPLGENNSLFTNEHRLNEATLNAVNDLSYELIKNQK